MSLSLKDKMTRFTPIRCRLLARRKASQTSVVAKSDAEIAAESGLNIGVVKGLSWCRSWDGIPVNVMLAYTIGCGVDFDDSASLKKNWAFLNKIGRASYLKRSPEWKTLYAPLCKEAAKY